MSLIGTHIYNKRIGQHTLGLHRYLRFTIPDASGPQVLVHFSDLYFNICDGSLEQVVRFYTYKFVLK